ncbi:glycosyltransferase family 4 protein [Falsiroseomonas sp.]|uniref:glycosyltransferase family 4 protein n=1 Tax=Falsiroseomonas sp. TaxID=2870721 RepID=UPI002727BFA1|nr:glycosyltransferase family 4 protein [Falsiroseomonas sp.]MDO9499283.1 glycosyltransferase family 4 protein [Falsiroseomonas sp.]
MTAERRRILYVQPNSEVGGSDIALLRTVEALDPDRFAPVVVLPAEGPLAPMLRAAGATVRLLPMMQLRTLPSPAYQTRYLARIWPTVRRLAALMREERAELVHTNSLYCLYGGFAARLAGVPHLWHVREIPPAIPVARPALGRMVLALSRMVVCMTQACADPLFGRQAKDRRIRLLSEGLDLREWSRAAITRSIRAELGIPATAPVIGFVARLDPWKGLDVFLEAAARIAPEFPDAIFLVSGDAPAGFEAYRDAMVARAEALGLGGRIQFLGWRYRLADIPALMADLDIFCHTSIAPEPFGLVIIEAMAMGCPVIAARAGGPMEIVEDGVSGLLTPPGDADALAGALRGLLADPGHRARIAAAGRARVEAVYSRAAFSTRLRALSEEALAGPLT